jgi:hypothetical protein
VQENNLSGLALADCVWLMLEHGVSSNAGGLSRCSAHTPAPHENDSIAISTQQRLLCEV